MAIIFFYYKNILSYSMYFFNHLISFLHIYIPYLCFKNYISYLMSQIEIKYVILKMAVCKNVMTKKEQKKILQAHPYSIWPGKDGKWRTYIPDNSRKNNRRLVKRSSEQDIKHYVVQFYQKQTMNKETTIATLYPEWLKYKALHVDSSNSIVRIQNDWNRYYISKNTNLHLPIPNIIDTPICTLTKLDLDTWIHSMIKYGNDIPSKSKRHKRQDMRSNMSKKQYYRMSIIMRESLEYAVQKGIIEKNPMKEISIKKNLYRKDAKKKDETQVFLIDEEKSIIDLAWRDFKKHPYDVSILAIILNFYIGTRVGELVALKRNDLNKQNYLHIQRMEVKDYDLTDIIHPKFKGYKVIPQTKSKAGDRELYMIPEAKFIYDLILKTLEKYHSNTSAYKEGYLFIRYGKRITHNRIEKILQAYCSQLNIDIKSNHKIRKTCLSTLIDSGLNINEIREFAGHEDERTTLNNYAFNRLNNIQTENLIEHALTKSVSVNFLHNPSEQL